MKSGAHNSVKIIFATAALLLLAACSSEPEYGPSDGINVHSAKSLIVDGEDIVVLDVRTPKEFAKGHIDGAVNINIHDPEFHKYAAKLDRDKTYIVHCAVNPRGGRGDKSIHIMGELGFPKLLSMDGGFNAWKRAGLPINQS